MGPKDSALAEEDREKLLDTLKNRFNAHPERHTGTLWQEVQAKLRAKPDIYEILNEMERTGGEPDVVSLPDTQGEWVFCDCSPESPKGRRSLCYDQEAREGRKKYPPNGSARELASEMGVELLSEAQYRKLQALGDFDCKTSSWVQTPPEVRDLGGAIFCDRRYGGVFTYHNGADSYYAARGFRAYLDI